MTSRQKGSIPAAVAQCMGECCMLPVHCQNFDAVSRFVFSHVVDRNAGHSYRGAVTMVSCIHIGRNTWDDEAAAKSDAD